MPILLYLRCLRCREPLQNHQFAYCPVCNTYLLYRAMPILFGMLMTSRREAEIRRPPARQVPLYDKGLIGYECAEAICWE